MTDLMPSRNTPKGSSESDTLGSSSSGRPEVESFVAETLEVATQEQDTDSEGPECHCKSLLTELSQMSYKSEICHKHVFYGYCSYGDICRFAHGLHELRAKEVDRRFKTMHCINWHQVGFCSHGKRCKFLHDEFRIEASPGEFLLIYPRSGIARVEHVPLTDTARLELLRHSIKRQEEEAKTIGTVTPRRPDAPSWMEARLSHSFSAPPLSLESSETGSEMMSVSRRSSMQPRRMDDFPGAPERSDFPPIGQTAGEEYPAEETPVGSAASTASYPGIAGSTHARGSEDYRSEHGGSASLPHGPESETSHASSPQQPFPMQMVPAYIDPYTGQVWPMAYLPQQHQQQQFQAYPQMGGSQEFPRVGHGSPQQQFLPPRAVYPGAYYSAPIPPQHPQQVDTASLYFPPPGPPVPYGAEFRQQQQLIYAKRRYSAQPRLGGGPPSHPPSLQPPQQLPTSGTGRRARASSAFVPGRTPARGGPLPPSASAPSISRFPPIHEESIPEEEAAEEGSTLPGFEEVSATIPPTTKDRVPATEASADGPLLQSPTAAPSFQPSSSSSSSPSPPPTEVPSTGGENPILSPRAGRSKSKPRRPSSRRRTRKKQPDF